MTDVVTAQFVKFKRYLVVDWLVLQNISLKIFNASLDFEISLLLFFIDRIYRIQNVWKELLLLFT